MKKRILLIIAIILLTFAGCGKKDEHSALLKELVRANTVKNRQSLHSVIYREYNRFSYFLQGEYQEGNTWAEETSYGSTSVLLYCCDDFAYALLDDSEFACMIADFSRCRGTWEKDTLSNLTKEKVLDVVQDEKNITVTTLSDQSISEQEEVNLMGSYLKEDIKRMENIYVFDAETKILQSRSVIIVYKDGQMQVCEKVVLEYDSPSDLSLIDRMFRVRYENAEAFRTLTFVVNGKQYSYQIPVGDAYYSDLYFKNVQYEIDYMNSTFDNDEHDNDVTIYLVPEE